MARFSVGGDEDGNEERPSNNNRPLPKRLRLSHPIGYTLKRTATSTAAAAAAAAAASNSRDSATTSAGAAAAPQPLGPLVAEEESEEQSTEDSETSWSDSSSESEEVSDEEEAEQQQQQQQQQIQRSGNAVQPTEARVDPTPNVNDTCRESEGSGGPVSVTLTDPDVLDCPICYEPLCSPVYQCENGHIACSPCCTIMKNKCANCCWPIGYNRCRAIEKVLESVRITCRNMPYGCMETLSYSKRLAHEKTCNYAPCSCPYIGCDYVGISKCVYSHFALKHSQSSKQFFFNSVISISLGNTEKHVYLQERSQSILFILNRSIETLGSFVNVVCVAPMSEKRAFLYDLTATIGESSIKLKTSADFMPKWMAQPPSKLSLLVPREFIGSSGQLKLELIIWRNPALAS